MLLVNDFPSPPRITAELPVSGEENTSSTTPDPAFAVTKRPTSEPGDTASIGAPADGFASADVLDRLRGR